MPSVKIKLNENIRDGKSPDLRVNEKQLQTAKQVNIYLEPLTQLVQKVVFLINSSKIHFVYV